MALPPGLNDEVLRRTLAMLNSTQGLGDQAEWTRRLRAELDPGNLQRTIDWYNTVRQADRLYLQTRGFGFVDERVGPLRGMPRDPTAVNTGYDYRARVAVTAHYQGGGHRGTVVVIDFDRATTSDQLRALAVARVQTELGQGLGPLPRGNTTGAIIFTTDFTSIGRSSVV